MPLGQELGLRGSAELWRHAGHERSRASLLAACRTSCRGGSNATATRRFAYGLDLARRAHGDPCRHWRSHYAGFSADTLFQGAYWLLEEAPAERQAEAWAQLDPIGLVRRLVEM